MKSLVRDVVDQCGLLLLFVVAVIAMAISVVLTLAAAVWCPQCGLSNCMLHAYRVYRRGGYVLMAKTHRSWWWRWPHFKSSVDGVEWHEYVPVGPRPIRWIPPLLFVGYERKCAIREDR